MISFFKYTDNKEGNIAIGKLPQNMISILENVNIHIPDKDITKCTYHNWCDNMLPTIKKDIDLIKNDPYWNQLNDTILTSTQINMDRMDEIYYSNPPSNMNRIILYGAAGNFSKHRDCVIFQFSGVKCYRVLIGLTNGNNNIVTYFNNYNYGHKINKYDYIAFDFNRTIHQVIKESSNDTPRLILKLHFLVYDKSYSKIYIAYIKKLYICYEYIFRYINEFGTNPETICQFFIGLLYQYGMNPYSIHILLFSCICSIFIKKMALFLIGGYFINVLLYWSRYKFFKIR